MFFPETEVYEIEDITFSINESYEKQSSRAPRKTVLRGFIFFALCLVFGSCIAHSQGKQRENQGTGSATGKDISGLIVSGNDNQGSISRYALNENALLDGLECSVTSFMFARHNGNLKYMDMAADGLVNCAVYITVKNTTNQQIPIWDYDVILFCDGKEYSQLVWEDPAFLFFQSDIPAETEWTQKIVDFQVPKELQDSEASMDICILGPSGQKPIWSLR